MISAYKTMWLLVGFDISTITKADIRKANNFRNDLLQLGFTRLQLSFYAYYCDSKEKAERISKEVGKLVPNNGHVTVFFLTDRQFGMTQNYFGGLRKDLDEPEQGILLF